MEREKRARREERKSKPKPPKTPLILQEAIERLLTTVILLLQFSVKQYTIMLTGPETAAKRV